MSRLRANQITNENANGAPNFPHGLTVTGVVTATTSATTMSQIVVGSAVTANSQGIDVTGVVTATQFKGDGSQLNWYFSRSCNRSINSTDGTTVVLDLSKDEHKVLAGHSHD